MDAIAFTFIRTTLTVVPDNRLPVLFGRLARTKIGFVVNVHAARDPMSLFRHMIDESGKFFLCWLVLRCGKWLLLVCMLLQVALLEVALLSWSTCMRQATPYPCVAM